MKILGSLLLFSVTFSLGATEILTGFRVETIARGQYGFVTSLVADSRGTIYFTTTNGWIHRVEGGTAVEVAKVTTESFGNGGLLGMALLDDETAVVHYTTWDDGIYDPNVVDPKVLDDVISRVDLATGEETVVHAFVCNVTLRELGVSSEHHGGNPIVGPDGSIFVGIGDFGNQLNSQTPERTGGRIWRIAADGAVTEWARGLRNPYDLAWDPELGRIVVADNGPVGGDEIHVANEGDNLGWPAEHAPEDAVPPDYVFPMTVAPTGLARLDGTNFMLRRGYLLGGFVTRALYYFPRVRPGAVDPPIPILDFFPEFVIDVTQAATGEIYFATSTFPNIVSIHRLHPPARGDCNGDGVVDAHDLTALALELAMDGHAQPMLQAHEGRHTGSWGCDANADGLISTADHDAILSMITPRRRSVRSR
jgi:glucose/arabinose dehydrogenase